MEKYPNVRKEVLDVMGGKVVECEADWILQRGICAIGVRHAKGKIKRITKKLINSEISIKPMQK